MIQESMPSIRPFNNDNMPHFAMFQARLQAAQSRQAAHQASLEGGSTVGSAARGLTSAPPRPTQLNEGEAQNALQNVQDATQHGPNLSSVHKGLDPDRVARLLGLLD